MTEILGLNAREVLDSRGNPTVEVDLITTKGSFRAMVPSGASTGIYEAVELRDGGDRYMGKGVQKAIDNIHNVITPEILGMNTKKQKEIDNVLIKLDGTDNKSNLGANAILAVSMAVCRAGAAAKNIPLYKHIADISGNKKLVMPVPSFNVINGGRHAGNKLAMQEFMILPIGAPNFKEALRYGSEIYHILKGLIKEEYGADATSVGDEGGFAPNIQSNKEAIELLMEAIETAGYKGKVMIGMDAAASEFFKDGKYNLAFKGRRKKEKTGKEMIDLYKGFIKESGMVLIEDPFDQDDWENYIKFTKEVGKNIQVVGDDLLVTNVKKIEEAIKKKACNALLLKVNQIGSVTEAIAAANMAKAAGWNVMVSHRSGETSDDFIADLVVGLGTGEIKSGAPCRSERLAKYNQLLRIEEDLQAPYAGKNFRKP